MNASYFKLNRSKILSKINNETLVVTAYSAIQRNRDAFFMFEQEANFWYLTGIEDPDWWVIIDGAQNKSWLVAPDIDDAHRIFDRGLSSKEAQKISGVDKVISREEADTLLKELASNRKNIYSIGDDPHANHYNFVLNPAPKELYSYLQEIFPEVKDFRPELAKLRAIKQPEEIDAIQAAVDLTVDAFQTVRNNFKDFNYEYEIEAEFSYMFRKAGAEGHAYDPIVAGGKNACTLHYNKNNDKLKQNSLVVIDIGARLGSYSADITRTYAVGEPTERQEAVHQSVVDSQNKTIKLLGPGKSIKQYLIDVDNIMKNELVKLGLMKSIDDDKNYRKYFPHSVSHGLGLDVHDSLGGYDKFMPGMVLTVEPGIYIPEEGIGVRIEDNILITDEGYVNLSQALSTSL